MDPEKLANSQGVGGLRFLCRQVKRFPFALDSRRWCMNPEAWGRKWAGQMKARFDALGDAHHFLLNTHGEKMVELILGGKH
jgi:hypothetical protein